MPLGRTPETTVADIIKIIIALCLPPVAVFFEVGASKHFFINIVLTLLGGIPGVVHALYIIVR